MMDVRICESSKHLFAASDYVFAVSFQRDGGTLTSSGCLGA
jgi:hypothetical protein